MESTSRWKRFRAEFFQDPIGAIEILFERNRPQPTTQDDISGSGQKYSNPPNKIASSSLPYKLDDVLWDVYLHDIGVWDTWTLRNAVQGVQIFGGIGSGKSSGSGQTLAKIYLKEGFGGVVLTAKMDELNAWEQYFDDVGRSRDDLIVFQAPHNDPDKKQYPEYSFNPLQYEMDRPGGGDTLNLTNLIMSIYEMGKSFTSGGSSSSGERYWDDQLRLYISRSIDLLKLVDAKDMISIANMREILTSAPDKDTAEAWQSNFSITTNDQTEDDFEKMTDQSFCLQCLFIAKIRDDMNEDERSTFKLVESYFLKEFAKLSEKTRSIVETSFYGMVEPFMGGILRKYFTKGVDDTIKPEKCYLEGKVIVINFPVKEHLVSGVYAQAIYKKIWQEVIERRELKKDGSDRPVFLWVDEAQYFLGKDDAKFQTTARSSMACTVFITQNMSNYYAAIGGKHPKATTDSLLGVLGTKIFHANNDYVTNEWAANTIGRDFRMQQSRSSNLGHLAGSLTESEALHYQVQPAEFTTLRSGGNLNDNEVDGIMTVAGKRWENGKNYVLVSFDQNFMTKNEQ